MSFQDIIFPFDRETLSSKIGTSRQAKYLLRYLTILKAKIIVVEKDYISKDYLIDYQKFYSRCFRAPNRFTTRIHFFSKKFSSDDLLKAIVDDEGSDDFQQHYLGFTIVKPISDDEDQPFLGCTLLKTYPKEFDGGHRHYITRSHKVSFFGMELEINALAFQSQDKGVSACATIALWTVFNALLPFFKLKERSPAEITEVSTKLPTESRIFPQGGLSLQQMITCIRLSDLDVEIISELNNLTIATAVKAFIDAGIPIIVDLELTLKEKHRTPKLKVEHHAAVIVGYRHDSQGQIDELYVHDDQIGPYSKVEPIEGKLVNWKNEWLSSESKFNKVKLEKLLIPIYHKLRLSWIDIYDFHKKYKKDAEEMGLKLGLFLITVQKYKKKIRKNKNVKEKLEALTHSLPRFLWVERFYKKENGIVDLHFDHLFDATAIYPNVELVVNYQ